MPIDYTATYNASASQTDMIRLRIMDIDVTTVAPGSAPTDRASWSCLFLDTEINAAASLYPINTINYTAAYLLDNIASNDALLAHRITIGDYTEDTRTVAKELHAQAEALRHSDDSIPAEMVTDEPYTDFNWTRMVVKPNPGG